MKLFHIIHCKSENVKPKLTVKNTSKKIMSEIKNLDISRLSCKVVWFLGDQKKSYSC